MWPFTKKKPEPKAEKTATRKKKTAKELATEKGEPYVEILSLDLDMDNPHQGAFELDWNDKFIANLVRAGYQMEANEEAHLIVDRWFQNICRHVVMETYEQEEANFPQNNRRPQEKDLGDGRKEIG